MLLAHLSELSNMNFSGGFAAVNLWNTINYNFFIFPNKMKKKEQILPDLNQGRKVSNNLWTNWAVWGEAAIFYPIA